MDSHAQQEIQDYAVIMAKMVETVCPLAFEAFMDYTVHAVTFSSIELEILKEKLVSITSDLESLMKSGLSRGEAREFKDKLKKIKNL